MVEKIITKTKVDKKGNITSVKVKGEDKFTSVKEIIKRDKSGEDFFTKDGNNKAKVNTIKNKYLKTTADKSKKNNLDNLKEK